MGSLPQELMQQIAVRVAKEFGLPLCLVELRVGTKDGLRRALERWREAEQMGVNFGGFAVRHITDVTRKAAKDIQARRAATERPAPQNEGAVEEALQTFSVDDWAAMIPLLHSRDLDVLLDYLRKNLKEAVRVYGGRKVSQVFNSASSQVLSRSFGSLVESGYITICPTDPMWAAIFWRRAREQNLRQRPRSVKRTTPESGRYKGIAESLSRQGHIVHDQQVRRWLNRLRQYPEWKDFLDRRGPRPKVDPAFWYKIVAPRTYKRWLQGLEQTKDWPTLLS